MNSQLKKFNIVKRRRLTSFVKEIFYTDDGRVILRTPFEYTYNKEFYMWANTDNPHVPQYEKLFSDDYSDYYICPEYDKLWGNKQINPDAYSKFFEMRRFYAKHFNFYSFYPETWKHNENLYKFIEKEMIPIFGRYAEAILNMAETLGENYQIKVRLDMQPRNVGFNNDKDLVLFDVVFSYGQSD